MDPTILQAARSSIIRWTPVPSCRGRSLDRHATYIVAAYIVGAAR